MKRMLVLGAVAIALLAAATAAAASSAAAASAPPSPWDGSNPFNCVLQNAGLGASVPDPGADPFCIYFDKTHQNVSQLGIVDFISKEPARTAAAAPKCFYFQEDHWRSSVIQSNGQTEIYEWIGHYFFNKATGDGGVYVQGFNLNGQTFDPTTFPGFPPQYGSYFGPGTGGFITHDDVPVDPACVALAQRQQVYATSTPRCLPGVGKATRRKIGPLTLGERENTVRQQVGPPQNVKRGFLHYCVTGGGSLLVGERTDRSGTFGSNAQNPGVLLATTSRGFVWRGRLHVGSKLRRHGRRLWRGVTVVRLRRNVLALVAHRRIRELVVYNPRAIRNWRTLRAYLRRAR